MRELSGLSHEDIAAALGISVGASKQTVFDARRSLLEIAEGREMGCEEVRRVVSDGDRRLLTGRRVRSHLRSCAACRDFSASIAERRATFRALSPVLPAAAAAGVLGRVTGATTSHAGGGAGVAGATAGKTAFVALGTKTAAVGLIVATTTVLTVHALRAPAHPAHRVTTTAAPPAARSHPVAVKNRAVIVHGTGRHTPASSRTATSGVHATPHVLLRPLRASKTHVAIIRHHPTAATSSSGSGQVGLMVPTKARRDHGAASSKHRAMGSGHRHARVKRGPSVRSHHRHNVRSHRHTPQRPHTNNGRQGANGSGQPQPSSGAHGSPQGAGSHGKPSTGSAGQAPATPSPTSGSPGQGGQSTSGQGPTGQTSPTPSPSTQQAGGHPPSAPTSAGSSETTPSSSGSTVTTAAPTSTIAAPPGHGQGDHSPSRR
jgi:hypothetical protein